MKEHLSDLELDGLRLDPAAGPAERRVHLEGCPRCQARSGELSAAATQFLAQHQLPGLAAEAMTRSQAQRSLRWLPIPIAVGVALASALLVLRGPTTDELRANGDGAWVEVYVVRGGDRVPLPPVVPLGASLAVRLSPPARSEVRILWRTAAGWEALFPAEDAPAWVVDAPTWLERSIDLDQDPAPETLGVIACRAPISTDDARAMLEATEPRADCRRLKQIIAKEPP